MRWLYDLGFLVFGIFSLPHFLKRLEQAEDRGRLVRERFGRYAPDTLRGWEGARPVWIHCVSVGEAMAAERFIRLLLERRPGQRIVVTTVTPTGQRVAKQWEGERLKVLYFPFDIRSAVRRFFDRIRPSLLLLVETEIWPNVLAEAGRRRVKVGVINGRLSPRSFRGFSRFSAIFKPLLGQIDFFLVQTEGDRERLLGLGVDPARVTVTGNMKLDALDMNGRWEGDRERLRREWNFLSSERILIGGSTHPGEEEILLRVFQRLRKEGFPLKLVLAPRHIERAERILRQAKKMGFPAMLTSRGTARRAPTFDVLILNQLGKLRDLYPLADVVFMGGSLIRHGGQNPVEPAVSRRAIIHGPWVFNFEEIYRRLDDAGGSRKVNDEKELLVILRRILTNDQEREHLGRLAHQTLRELAGATERNFQQIGEKL